MPIFRKSFQSSDTLDAAHYASLIDINEAFARKDEKLFLQNYPLTFSDF
jgi:hypothetical protein